MLIIVELNDGRKLKATMDNFDVQAFADKLNQSQKHDEAIVHGNNVFVRHQFKAAYEEEIQE